jgi:acetyl-CoA C-acetyltransferase
MGNVVSAGLGQNPARQAALGGGLPVEVAALTVNKVCGSGLKAVALAAQGVMTGDSSIVVAGGMESMSNTPFLLPFARDGYRLGDGTLVDSMLHDGLRDAFEHFHMGNTGEIVSEMYSISRQRQDEYALNSHLKAVRAIAEGRFKGEIVDVPVPQKNTEPRTFNTDEGPRPDATIEALRALKPAFKKEGTVTAGNAPGVNDGAAAVIVTSSERARIMGKPPLARIVGQAVSGIEPALVMMAPVKAVQKLLIAVMEQLQLPAEKVNVNGGAVALGHPIGASGARILVTLLFEMIRRDSKRGIAALCLGGGNAVALAVER